MSLLNNKINFQAIKLLCHILDRLNFYQFDLIIMLAVLDFSAFEIEQYLFKSMGLFQDKKCKIYHLNVFFILNPNMTIKFEFLKMKR